MIKLVHRPVNALQAERRNDLRRYLQSLVNLFFLFLGPCAKHEVNLRAACKLIAYAETHTRVRVCSYYGLYIA